VSQWKCFVAPRAYRFDDERNWALVKALLLDPDIGVVDPATGRVRPKDQGIRRILISRPLKDRLLVQARRDRVSRDLVDVAEAVMKQPSNAAAHDDHLHIDLNCAPGDVSRCGCLNTGMPPRPRVGARILDPASHRAQEHAYDLLGDGPREEQRDVPHEIDADVLDGRLRQDGALGRKHDVVVVGPDRDQTRLP